jgi:DNA-binding MarR family transcriptional regulator
MTKSAFGFQQPEDSPGFLLWQVTMTWQRKIKAALESYHVTHPQFVIMALLLWFSENNIEPTQSMIIEKSKLDKMTVSGSIKKLVSEGFVQRKECQQDTRAKLVKLTQKGKNLVIKLVPIVEGIDHDYFSRINSSDRRNLNKYLLQLSVI